MQTNTECVAVCIGSAFDLTTYNKEQMGSARKPATKKTVGASLEETPPPAQFCEDYSLSLVYFFD